MSWVPFSPVSATLWRSVLDLTQLNEPQREAVAHDGGPLLILAGAGSGKTRVLTHRIAHLVEAGHARPDEVLAVTFTNKAAREMRERLESLLDGDLRGLTVGTFHSVCARWLRRHAGRLGLPNSFAIYDDSDQLALCRRALQELEISEDLINPKTLRSFLDRTKNQAMDIRKQNPSDGGIRSDALVQASRHYEDLLSRAGAVDFGGLITSIVRLLQENPQTKADFQSRYRHVLVDEYQDINHAQYLLVDAIGGRDGNLCVVGDDDQSIYGFRGATVRAILDFERDHPNAKTIRLEQNYRSTANILAAAGAVIERNAGRHGKRLWTENGEGTKVTLALLSDDRAEARWVASEIGAEISRGRSPRDVAVFYRTHAQSRVLEEEFVRRGLRYVLVGGVRFYDRKEVKNVLAYLRLLTTPSDDVSLTRVINVPTRGIGMTTVRALSEHARERGSSLAAVLDELTENPASVNLARASAGRVVDFWQMMRGLRELAGESSLGDLVSAILRETGLLARLQAEANEEARARIDNLEELVGAAREIDDLTELPEGMTAIDAFLEQAALVSGLDSVDGEGSSLSMMTLHNSKGLEFPVVHLVGMEERVFPHARSVDEGTVEEERRLCYVGMTRAREQLRLSRAEVRLLSGVTQRNPSSRFLREIPEDLLRHVGLPQGRRAGASSASRRSGFYQSTEPFEDGLEAAQPRSEESNEPHVDYSVSQEYDGFDGDTPLRIGTKVRHPKFGAGVVRRKEGTGEGTKLTIQFERAGIKKLIARFAPLTFEGMENA